MFLAVLTCKTNNEGTFTKEDENVHRNYTYFSCFFGYAQKPESVMNTMNHHKALFEIGLSTGSVYLVEENICSTGFHTHITKQVSKTIPFSIGLGYESIID